MGLNRRADYAWGWAACLGVFLMALGAGVIALATYATIAISLIMGVALILGGIAQLFHTFGFNKRRRPVIQFLMSALSVIAGVILLRSPVVGALGITLILAFYLFFVGATKLALAFAWPRARGHGWMILSSIVSLFLGVCVFATFPITSLVIPGEVAIVQTESVDEKRAA